MEEVYMKKLFALLLSLVLIFGSASALAEVTVGFSQVGAESDWRVANTNNVIASLEAAGYKVVYDDAQNKQENQVKALRNFITQGVDYIVFTALVTTGWDEVLQEVIDAEIPLILIDRFPETELGEDFYATFMGSDFPEEGRRAGQEDRGPDKDGDRQHRYRPSPADSQCCNRAGGTPDADQCSLR